MHEQDRRDCGAASAGQRLDATPIAQLPAQAESRQSVTDLDHIENTADAQPAPATIPHTAPKRPTGMIAMSTITENASQHRAKSLGSEDSQATRVFRFRDGYPL
jgi:hypothetical protein